MWQPRRPRGYRPPPLADPVQRDTRQLDITLTDAGRDYARAITAVIEDLNREIASRVSPDRLAPSRSAPHRS